MKLEAGQLGVQEQLADISANGIRLVADVRTRIHTYAPATLVAVRKQHGSINLGTVNTHVLHTANAHAAVCLRALQEVLVLCAALHVQLRLSIQLS